LARFQFKSFGITSGPPKFTPNCSREEDGFGTACPFSENGAAFKAEFAKLTKTDPV
jgi:hypothetical protein